MKSCDFSSYQCPMPALMTRRELALLQKGQHIQIIVSEKQSADDIKLLCNQKNYQVSYQEKQDKFVIKITK